MREQIFRLLEEAYALGFADGSTAIPPTKPFEFDVMKPPTNLRFASRTSEEDEHSGVQQRPGTDVG